MRAGLLAVGGFVKALAAPFQIVHDEGDEHWINSALASFWVRFAALCALLAGIWALVHYGVTNLLAWTDRLFPVERYKFLFAGFALLYLGVHVAGERGRKPVLLVFSLAAMTYFHHWFAAVSVVFFGLYYLVVFAPVHRYVKLGFLCAAYAALIAASNMLWFPGLLTAEPWLVALAYAFAVNYTFRIFYFYHETKMRKFKRVSFVDFLLYFVFAPYFIIVPYMFAIPRYGTFAKSLATRDEKVEASGIRHLLAGAVICCIWYGLSRAYSPADELMAHLRGRDFVQAFFVGLLYYPIAAVLAALGVAYILTGMLRVLGIDIEPAFNRPLRSTSIHDWWRRWNIHFRDFLVDIFFYPLMIKWRKRNPYVTIVVGCVSVFIVGSTIFHWIGKYYFQVNSHTNVYWSILVENLLMCVAVAIGLCLEKRRILQKKRPPKPPKLSDESVPVATWMAHVTKRAAQLAGTYVFLLVVVVFAGYGATYVAYVRPAEQVMVPVNDAIALAGAGRRAEAADKVVPSLHRIESLIRHRPRDPVLRLSAAFVYSLPSPVQDPERVREHLEIAEAFWVEGHAAADLHRKRVLRLIGGVAPAPDGR